MKIRYKQTSTYALLALLLLLVLVLIPFPHTTSLQALVGPSAEYLVIRQGDGGFMTVERDCWNNRILSSSTWLPERGDLMEYRLNPVLDANRIRSGDTLAWINSARLNREILALEGALNTLQATLDFERSGSRAAIIETARRELTYAKTRLEEQQKILERTKSLLDGNIIPQQEYDLEVRKERLESVRVSIAEANLSAALTGAQTSKLEIFRTRIREEQQKLENMRSVLAELTITSPLAGDLHHSLSEDTLLVVRDLETCVIMLPIQSRVKHTLDWSSQVRILIDDEALIIHPEQISLDEEILQLGREQLVVARIRLANPGLRVLPGQRLDASVRYDSKSIFDLIRERF